MKHCKDCIHADKGHKEQPCADCAQLKQGGGVEMTRWEAQRGGVTHEAERRRVKKKPRVNGAASSYGIARQSAKSDVNPTYDPLD